LSGSQRKKPSLLLTKMRSRDFRGMFWQRNLSMCGRGCRLPFISPNSLWRSFLRKANQFDSSSFTLHAGLRKFSIFQINFGIETLARERLRHNNFQTIVILKPITTAQRLRSNQNHSNVALSKIGRQSKVDDYARPILICQATARTDDIVKIDLDACS
jgi:hypothetical protein